MTVRCPTCGHDVAAAPNCPMCGAMLAMPPTFEELRSGERLSGDRYEIVAVLGRGGFGITYQAYDHHLHREVAIKEMFPDGAYRHGSTVVFPTTIQRAGTDIRSQFLLEATTLARFRDAAIVQIFEVLEESGTVYVVMELVRGETYHDRVQRLGPLPAPEVEHVLRTVGGALRSVHDAGVLHRDVKPSNLMWSNGQPVLIDFGAARSFIADASQDMSRVVTPGFSPLEQYAGHARYGPASDVYALAATGYFLLTGAVPVDPASRLQGVELSPPVAGITGVTTQLVAAIQSGMNVAVRERAPDMHAFVGMLNDARRPTGPVGPAGPTTVRVDVREPGIADPSPDPAPDRSKRARHRVVVGAAGVLVAMVAAAGALLSRSGPPGSDPTTLVASDTAAQTVADSDDSAIGVVAEPATAPIVGETDPLPLRILEPTTARASATRPGVRLRCTGQWSDYDVRNLFDGDLNTGWGASRTDGSGESVTATFDTPVRVRRITVTPGFFREAPRSDQGCAVVNAHRFNRRIVDVEYRFDSGATVNQSLDAASTYQSIDVDVVTTSVTMTIRSTEKWGTDSDTIVSELRIEGAT